MGQTVAEKLLGRRAGRTVTAGELVVVPVDGAMASDTTAPLAIRAFADMGGTRVKDPARCILVIDHAAPAPTALIANLHAMMRGFAREQGCVLIEAGQGICHQVMVERGLVRPGDLVVGADSHTCTYGGIGAMGVGLGSTDLAAAWLTGRTWLKVPVSQRAVFHGRPRPGIMGKDLVLALLARTGIDGATYQSLEFSGEALAHLHPDGRLTLANMAIEAGAKTGVVLPPPTGADPPGMVRPDPDAAYVRTWELDAGALEPQVSPPHSPDQAVPVGELAGREVHYAFIGTCVNGRLEDLQAAARMLAGARVHPGVRLVVGPASAAVFAAALADGTVAALVAAGASFIPPGCGPCVGTHMGVPGDGEVVISTGNRNFRGRMGNPQAQVHLASPATVAASARTGRITDPREFWREARP